MLKLDTSQILPMTVRGPLAVLADKTITPPNAFADIWRTLEGVPSLSKQSLGSTKDGDLAVSEAAEEPVVIAVKDAQGSSEEPEGQAQSKADDVVTFPEGESLVSGPVPPLKLPPENASKALVLDVPTATTPALLPKTVAAKQGLDAPLSGQIQVAVARTVEGPEMVGNPVATKAENGGGISGDVEKNVNRSGGVPAEAQRPMFAGNPHASSVQNAVAVLASQMPVADPMKPIPLAQQVATKSFSTHRSGPQGSDLPNQPPVISEGARANHPDGAKPAPVQTPPMRGFVEASMTPPRPLSTGEPTERRTAKIAHPSPPQFPPTTFFQAAPGHVSLIVPPGLNDAVLEGGMPEDVEFSLPVTPHTFHSSRGAGAHPMQPHAPQVAQQIATATIQSRAGTTEIALNPEELGRVRMTLTTGESGLSVSIIAERPETADLMRRNIELLAKEFRDLGYESASFSFDGQSGGAGSDSSAPQGSRSTAETNPPDVLTPAPIVTVALRGGLDLKL